MLPFRTPLVSVNISLWKCTLIPLSQLLNVIFLPGGKEAAWGESTDLWAREGAFDQGSPRPERFSHKPEGLHFSRKAPLMWDPQSLPEPQGDWEVSRGLPAKAQSTWKACRLSWPLPFLSLRHQQALREPSEMPVPDPFLKDSDERVLGGTWGSVSELSPGRCKTQ